MRRQQRVEPLAELGRAVDRQRPGGQPVEGVVAVQHALLGGGVAGELQRCLDRLGPAVAEVDPVHPRCLGQQPLGEQPRQQRGVELHPVGQLSVEHVVQRLADDGMVPPGRENPESGQEVGVPVALAVVEVGTLGSFVDVVEADGVQHPGQLGVEVATGQLVSLPAARAQETGQIKGHGPFSPACADDRANNPVNTHCAIASDPVTAPSPCWATAPAGQRGTGPGN